MIFTYPLTKPQLTAFFRWLFILFGLAAVGFLFLSKFSPVRAVQYPIPQLGNCRDQYECHLYCEIPDNHASCWSYSVYGINVLGDESPEDKLALLGITFPVTELGNCATLNECRAYCDQEANKPACRTFAQTKKLTSKEIIIDKARSELGCSTVETCKVFCSEERSKGTCQTFAKKYHLRMVARDTMLEAARTELGCTTREQCKALCALPENGERCETLGKKFGKVSVREQLVERAKTELGCTSFASCRTFCQDKTNRDACRNFGAAVRTLQNKTNKDCGTPLECRKACAANPDKCPDFPKTQLPKSDATDGTITELDALERELNATGNESLETELNQL